MAANSNNNGDNGSQNSFTFNPDIDLFQGDSASIARDLHIIAEAFQQNPDLFKQVTTQAPITSQSNFSHNNDWTFTRNRPGEEQKPQFRSSGNILEDFENGFRDTLLDSLAGGDFKKGIQGALNTFTERFGFDLRNIGQEAGKQLANKFAESDFGKNIKGHIEKAGNSLIDNLFKNDATKSGFKDVFKSFLSGGGGSGSSSGGGFLQQLIGGAGSGGGAAGAEAAAMGGGEAAAAGAGTGAASAGAGAGAAGAGVAAGGMSALAMTGWGLLIIGIIVTIAKILGPALEGLAKLVTSLGKSFNREEEQRKKMAENARKRLEADMEWIAEKPFKILEEAAQKWEDAWDNNLRKIGQTQGYDKESVYALYESFAEKLGEEGLSGAIDATSIVDKLTSVLDSGLSGPVAERFAYIATKLNAAVPVEDFFSYASDYASIAANAIAAGKSQAEALDLADEQLNQFTSNLLFANREIAGGFSTGLKNASSLFKDAVQIAQAAKTNNSSEISSTLTSVSAIVGAVAPDLADSLVSNIVQSAVGGNSSQLVALRSLAGITASNTEFLHALATDSQTVFSNLFTNLANLQNMSPDNYMEVAEELSDIFGIDKNAFARVDFNYLASAIDAMPTNNNSLEENIALLKSGQTTTSAELLRYQEINNQIVENGLAYVIDSEAGRMIQQHMWDEQRDNAMMSHEYAVNLQGAALDFLEGIRKTLTTLYNFLNPVGFIAKGIANMTATMAEAFGNEQDLHEILKAEAVGSNQKSFYNLTTRGEDLKLTKSYVELLGGKKGIPAFNALAETMRWTGNIVSNLATGLISADEYNTLVHDPLKKAVNEFFNSDTERSISQRTTYGWGVVGKSFAKAMHDYSKPEAPAQPTTNLLTATANAAKKSLEESNARFQSFLDKVITPLYTDAQGIEHFLGETMSFTDWVATAVDNGIADFSEALKNYGKSEEEIRSYFETQQAKIGAKQEKARKDDEDLFRKENRAYWDYETGTSGVFQTAMWLPFFGENQKYDKRMDAVDTALSDIQFRIGSAENHTVISGIEELSRKLGNDTNFTVISALEHISTQIENTFIASSSVFQRCLADWIRYIAESREYTNTVSKSQAWNDFRNAEKDQQTEATLALAQALQVFSAEELQKMDPQLQTNALLGEIVIILHSIMQQTNTPGGLNLIDAISALGLGMTK